MNSLMSLRRNKSWLRNIREWTDIASAAEPFLLVTGTDYAVLTAKLHFPPMQMYSVVYFIVIGATTEYYTNFSFNLFNPIYE